MQNGKVSGPLRSRTFWKRNTRTKNSHTSGRFNYGGNSKGRTGLKKGRPKSIYRKWTKEVHHTWQIDGKEQVRSQGGRQHAWLTVADEASRSNLYVGLLAKSRMSQVEAADGTRIVNEAFAEWGMPKVIKIDNGLPFANPNLVNIPTLSVLWWTGLGIKVVFNTPGRPQENAMVENHQGTLCRWANPSECGNRHELQLALYEAGRVQRSVYCVRAKGNRTRLALYPELLTNPRTFSARLFSMERVHQFLSDQIWDRRVMKNGCAKFLDKELYVGRKYARHPITITFDQAENQWIVRKQNGTLLNKVPNRLITEELILDHVKLSKNFRA